MTKPKSNQASTRAYRGGTEPAETAEPVETDSVREEDLGPYVRRLRLALGVSIAQAARDLGVHRRQIERAELGKQIKPALDLIEYLTGTRPTAVYEVTLQKKSASKRR